jgi:hypothetical protein
MTRTIHSTVEHSGQRLVPHCAIGDNILVASRNYHLLIICLNILKSFTIYLADIVSPCLLKYQFVFSWNIWKIEPVSAHKLEL